MNPLEDHLSMLAVLKPKFSQTAAVQLFSWSICWLTLMLLLWW